MGGQEAKPSFSKQEANPALDSFFLPWSVYDSEVEPLTAL
jgi:hypothetical protein